MGPHGKKTGGKWKKRGQKKKTTRGNIFSFTEENAGQEKCGILYKHCFSYLYGLFWEEADKPKEKTGNGSGLGIVFPIGQKNSRKQLTRIFLFLVSAILLQVTLWRPSVSWWKLQQCYGHRLKAQPLLVFSVSVSSHLSCLHAAKKSFEALKIYRA